MKPDDFPSWHATVRAHWPKTTGFLLAFRQPCIAIRDQEIQAASGRVLVAGGIEDLEEWRPPKSWILGVLICPGDDVGPVAQWIQARKADASRVWFYLQPDVEVSVLEPWEQAGHPADQYDSAADWKQLHKRFGLALNDQVYADWKDVPPTSPD